MDGTSTRTDPFISGKKYRKLVNDAVFMKAYSLFQQRLYECIPITAHATVATQYMPCMWAMKYKLSNMDKHLSFRSMGNTMGEYTRYINITNIFIGPSRVCSSQ